VGTCITAIPSALCPEGLFGVSCGALVLGTAGLIYGQAPALDALIIDRLFGDCRSI
jgi:hypothetical protein